MSRTATLGRAQVAAVVVIVAIIAIMAMAASALTGCLSIAHPDFRPELSKTLARIWHFVMG